MYEKTAVDCRIHASPRRRPASERIELTVTYSDESAEFRELFYGKKGIIHRFMELTPEVKLEYARKVDICLQLPMPFLTFSQCGSFITEDPYGAVRYIEALDAEALKAELDSRPKLSEEFKHKVLEQAKL